MVVFIRWVRRVPFFLRSAISFLISRLQQSLKKPWSLDMKAYLNWWLNWLHGRPGQIPREQERPSVLILATSLCLLSLHSQKMSGEDMVSAGRNIEFALVGPILCWAYPHILKIGTALFNPSDSAEESQTCMLQNSDWVKVHGTVVEGE